MSQLYRLARRFITVGREQKLRSMWAKAIPVRHRSCAQNVYHCCVWKTASQWVRNVLSTTEVYRYSGLLPYAYEHHQGVDERNLEDKTFDQPFPTGKIVSPIYVNFESFAEMPKPESYRTFFVLRDPRDLIVSHYFSSRYSHVENPGVLDERSRLDGLTDSEGLVVHLKYMAKRGIFDALDSWARESNRDERVQVFRFEDLVGTDQQEWVMKLLDHCDIKTPEDQVARILERLSFKNLSGGRAQGQEDKKHKYRSGKHGDWKKYFDEPVLEAYEETAGDLTHRLGYE